MSAYKLAILIGLAIGAAYLVIQLAPVFLIGAVIAIFLKLEKSDQENNSNNEK